MKLVNTGKGVDLYPEIISGKISCPDCKKNEEIYDTGVDIFNCPCGCVWQTNYKNGEKEILAKFDDKVKSRIKS